MVYFAIFPFTLYETQPFIKPRHLILQLQHVKKPSQPLIPRHDIETTQMCKFTKVDGTQEHGLSEVFVQMTRSIHATFVVYAMVDAQEVCNLVDQ